ncbi:hypothetical protein ACHAXT_011343 [Thalassiosira profunda]
MANDFAEQLAARAAKKRSSLGSACSSDGGGGGSAPGIRRTRAAEKSASSHNAAGGTSRPARKEPSKKESIPKEGLPTNEGDARMSFGTAIKAKSSKNIANPEASARQSSFNDSLLSMSSVEGDNNRRGSFNTSINSLSESIKQRRVSDSEEDEGVSDLRRDKPQSSPARDKAKALLLCVDYREKADKYKTENKRLRKESLMLKARLEELDQQKGSSTSHKQKKNAAKDGSKVPGEEAKLEEEHRDLQKKFKELEIKLWQKNKVEEENEILRRRMTGKGLDKIGDNIDWSDRSSGVALLQESNRSGKGKGKGKGKGILKKTSSREGLDQSTRSEMSRDDLLAENVRLSQMLLELGELEELEKLRTSNMGEADKNAAILHLKQKQKETDRELAEVTELKNAEIALLRKQLDRAEHRRTGQEVEPGKEKGWEDERSGLREEIRRLNKEVSALRGKGGNRESYRDEDQEDAALTSRYVPTSNGGSSAARELDGTDVASLQSIIAMMRQTIDQSNREKELLEQQLSEEQERSQMELRAFAKTLEGVDDLRQSAEAMSREIRRIKVKGYRPTRSDLLGGSGSLEGVRNFGELTAAVEASESMEDAIRMIESQNDAMEERRRMGVVASQAAASETPAKKKERRYRGGGLGPIPDDSDGGGFLSFWNGEGRDEKKDERKKKSKRKSKKRGDGDGSVLTSFF